MATTVKLKKLLHRKVWEFCTPAPTGTTNGSFVAGDNDGLMPSNDCVYFVASASSIWNYNAEQDAWLQLPSAGVAGSFGAGSCGEFRAIGALGGSTVNTATAGTTTQLTTNRTIVRDIRGCKIRVVAGTGSGYEGVVVSTTAGSNSILTVSPASSVAFDATTQYSVWSGSMWFFNAGTTAVGFAVYDRATNAWTQKSVTNLPTSWGTDGQLVSTGSLQGVFSTGTAIAGSTTTTLNTSVTFPVNCWSNYQVRITSGTGAGQIRVVASNTAGPNSVLTVAAAWTVTPDATSVFAIEGNDDAMYLLGNAAAAIYKYSISANTWTVLTPGTTRGGAMSSGGTADWIGVINDAEWQGIPSKAINTSWPTAFKQGGRYIYSFRGAGTNTLDVYDIALNWWMNGVPYGNQAETFNSGSCSVASSDYLYIQKESTGRVFRFDIIKLAIEPWVTNVYPQSTTLAGDKMFFSTYRDGATVVRWAYTLHHNRADLLRMMEIY